MTPVTKEHPFALPVARPNCIDTSSRPSSRRGSAMACWSSSSASMAVSSQGRRGGRGLGESCRRLANRGGLGTSLQSPIHDCERQKKWPSRGARRCRPDQRGRHAFARGAVRAFEGELALRDVSSLASSITLKEGFNGDGAVVSYLNNVRTTKGTVAP